MVSNAEVDSADVDYDDTFASECRADGALIDETPAQVTTTKLLRKPTCHSCRKKKSKCSREQPCSQCVKSGVECTYDGKRVRGGIKTGFVERIHQRMDALENMFLGHGILLQQFMRDVEERHVDRRAGSEHPDTVLSHTTRFKQALHSLQSSCDLRTDEPGYRQLQTPTLKRRSDSEEQLAPSKRLRATAMEDLCAINPLPKEVEYVMIKYFEIVHPWVPILHPLTFSRRARELVRSEPVNMVLRAIIAVAARYVQGGNSDDVHDLGDYVDVCRQKALSAAMGSSSVEAIQTLLLLAFDATSIGNSHSPWSLTSIIVGKVNELQLNVEDIHPRKSYAEYFQKAPPSLEPPGTWAEAEERRRVFWATFILDRFCSISIGTNPTMPSKGIHRRLPCDGTWWISDQGVETSYFKLDDQHQRETSSTVGASPFSTQNENNEGAARIGGLAHLVDATESLSLISRFNLGHSLEPNDSTQLSAWLNRFRQLDSRLLQWELSLAHRWRDVRVINGYIDENLALAHVTHNAAIIMLHDQLAHPSPESRSWLSSLVSTASREACVVAAKKIDKFCRRYLAVSDGIAPAQFALCLFIAGQVLLTQASYQTARPPDEVGSIITSLNEISQRLCPDSPNNNVSETPAAKLAKTLIERRHRDSQTEMAGSKSQQHAPRLNGDAAHTNADIQGILQHCATSPSSGITAEGLTPFVLDGLGHFNDRFTDANQLSHSGSGASPPPIPISSLLADGDRIETAEGSSRRDFIPISDLLRHESRARMHNPTLDNRNSETGQRNGDAHFS